LSQTLSWVPPGRQSRRWTTHRTHGWDCPQNTQMHRWKKEMPGKYTDGIAHRTHRCTEMEEEDAWEIHGWDCPQNTQMHTDGRRRCLGSTRMGLPTEHTDAHRWKKKMSGKYTDGIAHRTHRCTQMEEGDVWEVHGWDCPQNTQMHTDGRRRCLGSARMGLPTEHADTRRLSLARNERPETRNWRPECRRVDVAAKQCLTSRRV
jgi:hypothetical protein